MKPDNLHGRNEFGHWMQSKHTTTDWQWNFAVIIAAVVIILMLITAIHL